jgi:hypothetical protein
MFKALRQSKVGGERNEDIRNGRDAFVYLSKRTHYVLDLELVSIRSKVSEKKGNRGNELFIGEFKVKDVVVESETATTPSVGSTVSYYLNLSKGDLDAQDATFSDMVRCLAGIRGIPAPEMLQAHCDTEEDTLSIIEEMFVDDGAAFAGTVVRYETSEEANDSGFHRLTWELISPPTATKGKTKAKKN